jgi:hypothetical protein
LTRTHRILIGVVVAGAVVIAGIGFAGSYAAVRQLALDKGFGWFANVFPIGVDAGIVVLLSLDLLLTWLRIPFPLLRQTAWLLTAATIAFNGAAAWPDGLGVGMHAIIPVLFVVSVEAARHAIGRIADITADKHMEGVRFTRWLLAPFPTFRLWRRMKLWELRSYEEVIRREQDRLVYRARLRARYGVNWRRRAPVEAVMPLRLAKYGVPLADTMDAGLAAAGIELAAVPGPKELAAAPGLEQGEEGEKGAAPEPAARPAAEPVDVPEPLYAEEVYGHPYDPRYDPRYDPAFDPGYDPRYDPRYAYDQQQAQAQALPPEPEPAPEPDPVPEVRIPNGPNRTRPLGANGSAATRTIPAPRTEEPDPAPLTSGLDIPDGVSVEEAYFAAYRQYVREQGHFPNARQFARYLPSLYGGTGPEERDLVASIRDMRYRFQSEADTEHIP